MGEYDYLAELPGSPQEQAWLKERLDTLSVKEGHVLAAALMRQPLKNAADAIDRFQSLNDYEVCFPAGSYEQLGQFYAEHGAKPPDSVLPHVDMEQLGQRYEDNHPGVFVGSCYVMYPDFESIHRRVSLLLEDNDWSVKLKLASPAVPEGVWLRLPDHDGNIAENSSEVKLALHELRAESLEDCTVLEARCILPEVGDLMKQYDSVTELVRDGDSLGFVLDEQGQGEAHWMEKFAAALEYEDCRTLKFALDISQNMNCYEWIPCDGLEGFAVDHLRSCGMKDELIQSCPIDLKGYAEDLLETAGYMEASGETGYLIRNGREFIHEYAITEKEAPAHQDVLKAFPQLERLSSYAGPEEADDARAAITEALTGCGSDGIRQLQAAMEYEDCASLTEAVEISGRLDCYDFVDMGELCQTAKRELLAKGLDKRFVDLCINFESYAAITYDFEDIYSSHGTGLYVHKNESPVQQESLGGMTMQ